ncbi:hypothetical protein [Luteimonas terricola]|uniref:Uncharacterized protein n=1 Tax=Luteimonas terricola TaxID=645597 RepID=A0ABQ2E815_9GAMM|nr:hypothetical protein [Luteimonas terricola]GGK00230.1 hypothetical protein GCM10011394_06810 [Luteimonas terricola]
MNPSFAQATPQPMQPGDAGYNVVLDAATRPLRDALGGQVELEVERMDRVGSWAFVLGNMRAPDGGRPDLSGTSFADASAQGAMSDVYVVLLRHEQDSRPADEGEAADTGVPADADAAASAAPAAAAARDQSGAPAGAEGFPSGGTWRVLDHAIGPGDVAWIDWPQAHAAPRALFGF